MVENANLVAWAALLSFPIVALAVVAWARGRWPLAQTTSVLMIGAIMFLPSRLELDLPALPAFGKATISAASVYFACLVYHRDRVRSASLLETPGALLGVMLVTGIGTWLTNTDTLVYGPTVLAAMSAYDAFQFGVEIIASVGFPMAVGRIAFRTPEDVATLLRVLASAGLVYTPLVLLEVRMSPQLHTWVFGYAAFEDWLQAIRAGGFRPNVFMNHGLSVALFVLMTLIASATLWKVDGRVFGRPAKWATLCMAVVEVACRSLGALIYALTFLPMIALSRPKRQVQLACILGIIALTYPVLRTTSLFPTDELTELAASYDADRAQSLEFRFVNEDALVTKAVERVVFGWGGYGRNQIFDHWTGEDLSVTDGTWIIVLGQRGAIAWLCSFLLLLLPVFQLRRVITATSNRSAVLLAGLGLIVACHTVDLLPNSLSDNLPYFYAGALGAVIRTLERRSTHPTRAARKAARPRPSLDEANA
jgi:hypothetical protein